MPGKHLKHPVQGAKGRVLQDEEDFGAANCERWLDAFCLLTTTRHESSTENVFFIETPCPSACFGRHNKNEFVRVCKMSDGAI